MRILGPENKLLAFAVHPLELAAGHLGAENILETAERFRKWYSANNQIENEDLERAVARSALLADVFCMLDALPAQPSIGPSATMLARLRRWLPEKPIRGIISQAEDSLILPLIHSRQQQLRQIEEGPFISAQIDPLKLVVPESIENWGTMLATEALAELEREQRNIPERLRNIYKERWFSYLCLAFQEEIKTNTRVSTIFHSLQISTGWVRIEDVIRKEEAETRRLIRETWNRPMAAPLDLYASVRAPSQNYIERPELEKQIRDLILQPNRPVALVAFEGMGGIGKTELARRLCHGKEVRDVFTDGIVWLDIGRESQSTTLDRMKEIGEKLNDDPGSYSETTCETRYRTLLTKRAVLIVLDDIWNVDDVEPFILPPSAVGCRLLFTTRNARVAAEIGASSCSIDLLNDEEARKILARYANIESDGLPSVSAEIITECGNLPHALAVVGSALKHQPVERWSDLLQKLRDSRVAKLLAPSALSVDELGKQDPLSRDRYIELAVLLEDMVVSQPLLQTLWG